MTVVMREKESRSGERCVFWWKCGRCCFVWRRRLGEEEEERGGGWGIVGVGRTLS